MDGQEWTNNNQAVISNNTENYYKIKIIFNFYQVLHFSLQGTQSITPSIAKYPSKHPHSGKSRLL